MTVVQCVAGVDGGVKAHTGGPTHSVKAVVNHGAALACAGGSFGDGDDVP